MELDAAKMLGAGLATMGVAGAGIGIGVLFGNYVGSGIRNPAGYLFGVIQKAIKGEFHAWAGQNGQTAVASSSPSPAITPASRPIQCP